MSKNTTAGYATEQPMSATVKDRSILRRLASSMATSLWAYRTKTIGQHDTILRTYIRFCLAYGHLPYTEKGISTHVLMEYTVYLVKSAISVNSINNYTSMGPRLLAEHMNVPWVPTSLRPKLKRVLKAIHRQYGRPISRKRPITIQQLLQIYDVIDHTTLKGATIWASILLGFFAFLRKSTFAIQPNEVFDSAVDLTIDSIGITQNRMHVTVKKTKTIQDQERQLQLLLPNKQAKLNNITAMKNMLVLRTDSYDAIAPLFKLKQNGTAMTTAEFDTEFKRLLKKAKLTGKDLSPHSLRRGGTTYGLQCGCDKTCLQLQGDWASDAWVLYAWVQGSIKLETVGHLESRVDY